jgi:hypothetical protein
MHMCELSLLHRLAEGHYRQVKGSDTSPLLYPPLAALIGGVFFTCSSSAEGGSSFSSSDWGSTGGSEQRDQSCTCVSSHCCTG